MRQTLWQYADDNRGSAEQYAFTSRLLTCMVSGRYTEAWISEPNRRHVNERITGNLLCLTRWGAAEKANLDLFAHRIEVAPEHFKGFCERFAQGNCRPGETLRRLWFNDVLQTYCPSEVSPGPQKPCEPESEPRPGPRNSVFRLQSKSGDPVNNLSDWEKHARTAHWRPGYSAYEFAARWCSGLPNLPDELLSLFRSHVLTRDFTPEVGVIECCTGFDPFPGGVRNHDMVIRGRDSDRRINMQTTVGIEAKVGESFGPNVADYYEQSREGNVRKRLHLLSLSLYGTPICVPLRGLRYQLLHGLGATIAEAKNSGAHLAVFAVWELGDRSNRREENHHDFVNFVHSFPALQGENVETGSLYGPISVPGGPWIPGNIPVLIGKVSTPATSTSTTSGMPAAASADASNPRTLNTP